MKDTRRVKLGILLSHTIGVNLDDIAAVKTFGEWVVAGTPTDPSEVLPCPGNKPTQIILSQHPDLPTVAPESLDGSNWQEYLAEQQAKFGKTLVISRPTEKPDNYAFQLEKDADGYFRLTQGTHLRMRGFSLRTTSRDFDECLKVWLHDHLVHSGPVYIDAASQAALLKSKHPAARLILEDVSDEPAATPIIERASLTPEEVEFFNTLGYKNCDFELFNGHYRYKWHWQE